MSILRRMFHAIFGRFLSDYPSLNCYSSLWAVYLTRAQYIAAELGIADLLRERPQTAAELAAATGTHEASLHRVLRALAAFGIFVEDEQCRYCLTPGAWPLLTGAPGSVRHWAMVTGNRATWDGFGRALDTVKTGQIGFEIEHGVSFYEYCRQHADFGETFIQGMSGWTDWQATEIVKVFNFGRFPKVVDVGGGRGSLIMEIVAKNPGTRGVLFDQPAGVASARLRIAERGLADRCEAVEGSFFDGVPAGGDAYTLKHVLRDWDDDHAVRILANCRAAMPAHARLMVLDAVLDPRNGKDRWVKLIDLEQMLWVSGRLRTTEEWAGLLRKAGFRWTRTYRTSFSDTKVIETVKA